MKNLYFYCEHVVEHTNKDNYNTAWFIHVQRHSSLVPWSLVCIGHEAQSCADDFLSLYGLVILRGGRLPSRYTVNKVQEGQHILGYVLVMKYTIE